MTSSLGEELPKEQARVRRLLVEYTALGPVGAFGATFIEQALGAADQAVMRGDLAAMITAYKDLKACE